MWEVRTFLAEWILSILNTKIHYLFSDVVCQSIKRDSGRKPSSRPKRKLGIIELPMPPMIYDPEADEAEDADVEDHRSNRSRYDFLKKEMCLLKSPRLPGRIIK